MRRPAFFQVSSTHGQIVNPALFRRVIRIDPIHLGYWMSLCGLILSHEPIRKAQHDRIVPRLSDELEANGQPTVVEAARHADGGQPKVIREDRERW